MAKWYDIDTSVRINGGLTVNGDISIPSGNTIRGDGSQLTNLPIPVSSAMSVNGGTGPISSGWAYSHERTYGVGSHIPTGGTTSTFLRGDGTWATVATANNFVSGISSTAGGNGTLTVNRAGLADLTINLAHNHDSSYLGVNAKATDSDKLDGYDSSDFARSIFKTYNAVTGDDGTDGWYTIFSVGDTRLAQCNLRAYAHSFVSFIVSKSYGTDSCFITLQHTNVTNTNPGYKHLKGIRVLDGGKVQIKLNGGATTMIEMQLIGNGVGFTIEPTLIKETGTPIVTQSIDPIINGTIVSKGDVYVAGNKLFHVGNDGAGSGLDADLLDGLDSNKFVRNDLDNTLNGALTITKTGNAVDILTFNTERAWKFMQSGTGAGTNLALRDVTGDKLFLIQNNAGQDAIRIFPANIVANSRIEINGNAVWHAGNFDPNTKANTHTHPYLEVYSGGTIDVNTVQGTRLHAGTSGTWTNRGPSVHNGSSILSINTHPGDYHSQLWFDTGGDNFYHRTRDAGTVRAWRKVWTEGNDGTGSGLDADLIDGVQLTSLVRSDVDNQSVNNGFTIKGGAWIGQTGTAGNLIIRKSDGVGGIQLSGDNTAELAGVGSYITASGNAKFDGTVQVATLKVDTAGQVANLNADMIDGLHSKDLSRREIAYEVGGAGIYSGFLAKQSGVSGHQTQITIDPGVVYTSSGQRFSWAGGDISTIGPSTTANNNRIDVAYVAGPSEGNNEGTLKIIQGSYAITPTVPSIPSDGIKICEISILANQGTITNAKITDKRAYKPVKFMPDGRLDLDYLRVTNLTSYLGSIYIDKPFRATFAKTVLIAKGQTSYTWTHNFNLTSYAISLSCDSPEPHVYWSNKTANSVTINLDDVCDSDVTVDMVITGI